MHSVVVQMTVLIGCGLGWRLLRPAGLGADPLRQAIATLVYHLLLPALVLLVLWRTPLGLHSIKIAVSATIGIFSSMLIIALLCQWHAYPKRVAGALVLAASFPNATFMGLPFLESVYGETGRSVAIQYDLFACTPILLTLGIMMARHYGSAEQALHPLHALLRVPPLWAAACGVLLNLASIPLPGSVEAVLDLLGQGVIPLMLLSLGLGLRVSSWQPAYLPGLVYVLCIQLFVAPAAVWVSTQLLELEGVARQGTVLEAAMPSMVLGLVLCDRFALDSSLYSVIVTLTTVSSLITLPLWYGWLTS